MAKKLYIGGLAYTATQDVLRDAFTKAGEVTSAMIVMDKMTGRSRGFGFVEMTDDAGAAAAIEMFNGKTAEGLSYGDRGLLVNEARPMEPRAPRTGGFGGGDRGGRGGRDSAPRNNW